MVAASVSRPQYMAQFTTKPDADQKPSKTDIICDDNRVAAGVAILRSILKDVVNVHIMSYNQDTDDLEIFIEDCRAKVTIFNKINFFFTIINI